MFESTLTVLQRVEESTVGSSFDCRANVVFSVLVAIEPIHRTKMSISAVEARNGAKLDSAAM